MATNSNIKVKKKERDSWKSQKFNNECIFEIDDINFNDDLRSYVNSNQDESDSDSSEKLSSDSQTHCNKIFSVKTLATSLPVNVPIWKASNHFHDGDDSENELNDKIEKCEDPIKTYQSIKALAASVQDGTEMFGDLPRRRLNTGDLVKSRPI